jgi:hypothetical protein
MMKHGANEGEQEQSKEIPITSFNQRATYVELSIIRESTSQLLEQVNALAVSQSVHESTILARDKPIIKTRRFEQFLNV